MNVKVFQNTSVVRGLTYIMSERNACVDLFLLTNHEPNEMSFFFVGNPMIHVTHRRHLTPAAKIQTKTVADKNRRY